MFGSGTTTLIISNEEMNDIMKIIKSFEESCFLIKGVDKSIKNEAEEQKKRIFWNVIRHFRCQFIREFINESRTRHDHSRQRHN